MLGYFIQTNYIGTVADWMNKQTYSYGSKNSSGQIMATALILCVFYLSDSKKNKLLSVLMWAAAVFLGFMILMVQCRTAMLGLVIAVGSYLIVKVKSDRRRSGLMLMVLILAVLFLTNKFCLEYY